MYQSQYCIFRMWRGWSFALRTRHRGPVDLAHDAHVSRGVGTPMDRPAVKDDSENVVGWVIQDLVDASHSRAMTYLAV